MNDIEFEAHAKDADAWVYAGFNFETIYSKNKAMLDGFVSIQNKRVFDYSSNAWFEQRYAEPGEFLVFTTFIRKTRFSLCLYVNTK